MRPAAPLSTDLIPAASAAERVQKAAEVATALKDVVVKQGLRTKVGNQKKLDRETGEPVKDGNGRDVWEPRWHPDVEAWQTLATMLGVALVERHPGPVPVLDPSTGLPLVRRFTVRERRENKRTGEVTHREFEVAGHDWQATYDVVKDGAIVGSASGLCSRSEATWAQRDEYAVRGMAQTRAESRAMRAVAAWVMAMAGYATTPSEEMPRGAGGDESEAPPTAAWASEAAPARKRQALESLAYLLDPTGEDPAVDLSGGARALATRTLTEIGEDLGLVPEAVALAFARSAGALQRALQDAEREPPPAQGEGDAVRLDFGRLGPEDGGA